MLYFIIYIMCVYILLYAIIYKYAMYSYHILLCMYI